MICGLCGRGGATKKVRDAIGQPFTVHRPCWLSVQQDAGNLIRNLTPEARKTAKAPRAEEGSR